jgi:serine/threonine protein phosphatase PrpC
MISDGNQFLAAQEDGSVVMTNDTTLSYLWTLKTLEQRLAELANATPENPVDATKLLIQAANDAGGVDNVTAIIIR